MPRCGNRRARGAVSPTLLKGSARRPKAGRGYPPDAALCRSPAPPLEPVRPCRLVAFQREVQQAVEQLGVADIPSASNSEAYTLVWVKPGIVLSSLTSTCSPSTKKSTRARPGAAGAQERVDGQLADALADVGGDAGRHDQLHPARRVLGLVVVPAALARRRAGSRPAGRRSGRALPSTEHSTSMPRAAASTITSGSCANACSSARRELARRRRPARSRPRSRAEPA